MTSLKRTAGAAFYALALVGCATGQPNVPARPGIPRLDAAFRTQREPRT